MDYREIAGSIRQALNSSCPAVAVSFAGERPAKVPIYSGAAPAGCVFWEEGGKSAFATDAAAHSMCAIGIHTHNLADPPPDFQSELETVLKVLAGMDYVRPEDVAQIPVLNGRPRFVLYGPLEEAQAAPEAVLVFAEARQGLILAEAIQQVDGDVPPALGRPACAIIPQVVNTGRAAMSLGCCGARAYLSALTDDMALWAFPGSRIGEYAGRIVTLAKTNERLGRFHQLRMKDIRDGLRPSYAESLARLQS
jgi:uncharacterized protein (DUF169 family)